jgi:uncharacterized protein (DUF2147 family)
MTKNTRAALLTACLAATPTSLLAADPEGVWMSADRDAKVRIARCGEGLCGTVVWLRNARDPQTGAPKTDKENPDASKQARPLIGLQVINGMKPSRPGFWSGRIYNADDGRTYKASLEILGPTRARVEGCVFSVLCKGETWTRAN